MEKLKEREPELVPVRRREAEPEKDIVRKPLEGEIPSVPEIPRRWRIY